MGSAPAAFADKFVYERRGALRAWRHACGGKAPQSSGGSRRNVRPGLRFPRNTFLSGQHISCDCDYPQIITLSYAALVRRICAAKTAGRSFDQNTRNVRTVHNAASIRYLGYS